MNTVTDLTGLHPRVVFDRAEVDRLRWFQANRYFEGGLLNEPPTALPNVPSVLASTYFGVYTGEGIQATARIVRATHGLPIFEHHDIYPAVAERLMSDYDSLAEISRLAVGTSTPHYRALALLSREFLRYGLRNQHATLLVASIEEPLVRILNRLLGIPLHIIGPSIDQYGPFNGATVPVLIDTAECLQAFRSRKSRKWEFFMEDLVIDLTADAHVGQHRSLMRAAS